MNQRLTVTDLVRNFREYISRVAYRGERFLLTRGGRPVAELRPVTAGRPLAELPELLASLPRLADAEAAAFEQNLEDARSELTKGAPPDRWES